MCMPAKLDRRLFFESLIETKRLAPDNHPVVIEIAESSVTDVSAMGKIKECWTK